jgi:HEPN domain-containing protein
MPADKKTVTVVREWIEKAEHDLTLAAHALKLKEKCPGDLVCFHAQQCIEKYLKSLLVLNRTAFPKTHDLGKLVSLLPRRARPRFAVGEQELLTEYATGARYPGWGDVSLAEARKSVGLARRIRREVRKLLPESTLRKKR